MNYLGKMMYILDTDLLIELSRGSSAVQGRMSEAGLSNCCISEISLAELYVGYFKKKRLDPLISFVEKYLAVVPVSGAIKQYAQIRAHLEEQGNRLEDMDLFIAATALAGGYTLVTHNTRHFSRIPGLQMEDWLEV